MTKTFKGCARVEGNEFQNLSVTILPALITLMPLMRKKKNTRAQLGIKLRPPRPLHVLY
jgi:hypothetical protein